MISRSYPGLCIAKKHNIPYQHVLNWMTVEARGGRDDLTFFERESEAWLEDWFRHDPARREAFKADCMGALAFYQYASRIGMVAALKSVGAA